MCLSKRIQVSGDRIGCRDLGPTWMILEHVLWNPVPCGKLEYLNPQSEPRAESGKCGSSVVRRHRVLPRIVPSCLRSQTTTCVGNHPANTHTHTQIHNDEIISHERVRNLRCLTKTLVSIFLRMETQYLPSTFHSIRKNEVGGNL